MAEQNQEKALELKAGIFVLIGLVFIASMAFKFGRLGQGLFTKYYPLTVTFPTADGLIKDSDVQLAGARIGYVSEKPAIAPGGSRVTVTVEVLSSVKVPKESTFEIGSTGLLGDKFVQISPKATFDASKFDANDPNQVLAPGDAISGVSGGGPLGALQTELSAEIQALKSVTDKIDNGILSAQNTQNITDIFTHLKGTSEHFDVASKDLDGVVLDAKTTIGTVNAAAGDIRGAIGTAQKTFGSVQETFDSAGKTLTAADQTLESVRGVLAKAQTGEGPIATLLNDPRLSQNLKVFVANLREHGVLFYKNNTQAAGAAAASPKPTR